jgi:hypothetical protein
MLVCICAIIVVICNICSWRELIAAADSAWCFSKRLPTERAARCARWRARSAA